MGTRQPLETWSNEDLEPGGFYDSELSRHNVHSVPPLVLASVTGPRYGQLYGPIEQGCRAYRTTGEIER